MRTHIVRNLLARIVLVGIAACSTTIGMAQEQTTQPTQPTQPSTTAPMPTERPSRGSTMESVRAKFGAPSQESPAVGNPPISRWDYPGYSVFFESDKVLHTVVMK